MPNPVFVDCPAETWKKVATNVTAGAIRRWDKSNSGYNHTFRPTGGTPPTDKAEGVPAFKNSNTETIKSNYAIDAYLFSLVDSGRVRVDL